MDVNTLRMKTLFPLFFWYFTWTTSKAAPSLSINGRSPRIIAGYPTFVGQFPYAAAIQVQTPTSRHFCGGTLYGTEWIVTAAQCVNRATLLTIGMGSISPIMTDGDPNRVTVATSIYYLHPEYNADSLENDIAVIQFREKILFTDYIKSISRLAREDVKMGIQVYSIGWGQISDADSGLASTLHLAFVGPIPNEQCKVYYGNQITVNMVCMTGSFNEGICNGDTGSPLIEQQKYGQEVVGVASFRSANGCETTEPSGFTRVFPYVEWIKNITGDLDHNVLP